MKPVQLLFLILLLSAISNAQDSTLVDSCIQKDLPDLLRVMLKKPPKTSKSVGSVLLIPIIGSNPATGFMLGIGGQYGFKLKGEETKFSLISGSMQFTTKKQALFLLKNSIYTKNNKIFLTGDWRYLIYSQATYGLGTNAPEGGILDYQYSLAGQETAIDSLAQPLKFNFLRFHQSASMRILKKYKGFFVGVGFYLDYFFKVVDEKLKLNPGDSLITSHYAYNTAYGFGTEKYDASSFNLNLISDTRDNMINAYKGHFLMVSFRGSLEWLGNDKNASFISAEWRSFHPVSKSNPRHQIAFWGLGDFSRDGDYPYLILPATAYDQRSRSARGYTQGRFRGNNLVYGEAEYRFPLSSCGGILGGVLFANATTASAPKQSLGLFESIKPGYGFGLRVMVDKKTRTNLAIDLGWGQKSFGFYLAASETF